MIEMAGSLSLSEDLEILSFGSDGEWDSDAHLSEMEDLLSSSDAALSSPIKFSSKDASCKLSLKAAPTVATTTAPKKRNPNQEQLNEEKEAIYMEGIEDEEELERSSDDGNGSFVSHEDSDVEENGDESTPTVGPMKHQIIFWELEHNLHSFGSTTRKDTSSDEGLTLVRAYVIIGSHPTLSCIKKEFAYQHPDRLVVQFFVNDDNKNSIEMLNCHTTKDYLGDETGEHERSLEWFRSLSAGEIVVISMLGEIQPNFVRQMLEAHSSLGSRFVNSPCLKVSEDSKDWQLNDRPLVTLTEDGWTEGEVLSSVLNRLDNYDSTKAEYSIKATPDKKNEQSMDLQKTIDHLIESHKKTYKKTLVVHSVLLAMCSAVVFLFIRANLGVTPYFPSYSFSVAPSTTSAGFNVSNASSIMTTTSSVPSLYETERGISAIYIHSKDAVAWLMKEMLDSWEQYLRKTHFLLRGVYNDVSSKVASLSASSEPFFEHVKYNLQEAMDRILHLSN